MLPYERVRKHKFNDKTYHIVWRKPRGNEGICSPPTQEPQSRSIFVNPRLNAKDFMEIILHEGMHAEQWYLDEDTVQRIALNLSDLLWKCGYRLTDDAGNIVERPKKSKKANP